MGESLVGGEGGHCHSGEASAQPSIAQSQQRMKTKEEERARPGNRSNKKKKKKKGQRQDFTRTTKKVDQGGIM